MPGGPGDITVKVVMQCETRRKSLGYVAGSCRWQMSHSSWELGRDVGRASRRQGGVVQGLKPEKQGAMAPLGRNRHGEGAGWTGWERAPSREGSRD